MKRLPPVPLFSEAELAAAFEQVLPSRVIGSMRSLIPVARRRRMHLPLLCLVLALTSAARLAAQGSPPAEPRDTIPAGVVRAYVDAFNTKALDAMMSYVAVDLVWFHVTSDSVRAGGSGVDAFRALLAGYVREVPSARSELLDLRALGPWVTTHERTRWSASPSGAGGQSSVVVYEVRNGVVRRIWYYPAAP